MLETTYRMTQKAIFHISLQPGLSIGLLEVIQGIVYDYVRKTYMFEADWPRFCTYGQEETNDQILRLQTAIYRDGDNKIDWALRLKTRDRAQRRRNWLCNISVHMESANEATLFYAHMYSNHLAGSFADAKLPLITIPSLFASLLHHPRILCKSGNYPLPDKATALDDDFVNDFIALVCDPDRHIPVVLIMCPDLLSPSLTAQQMIGNAIIYWLDDFQLFQEIQAQLKTEIDLVWDTVQILLPMTSDGKPPFHPVLTASDISRYGQEQTLAMLRQAYCTNLRSDERRSFVTLEELRQRRDRENIAALQNHVLALTEDTKALRSNNEMLVSELEALKKKYEEETDIKLKEDVVSLESMLTDSMNQYEAIKAGIQALIQQLYTCMGKDFTPSEVGEACLCELQRAIFVCFARLRGGR